MLFWKLFKIRKFKHRFIAFEIISLFNFDGIKIKIVRYLENFKRYSSF